MKSSIQFLFFFLSFAVSSSAVEPNSSADCVAILGNLQSKSSVLASSLPGIDALLESKPSVEVPVSVLFQVDLKDDEAVSKRANDLEKQTSENELRSQPEFKSFSTCAKEHEKRNLFDQTLQRQLELNQKRLKFLRLDKNLRDQLIGTYEASLQQITHKKQIEKQLNESKESLERAQTSLTKSEEGISKGESSHAGKVVASRTLLEKFLVDVEAEHIEFLRRIKSERTELDTLRTELSKHSDIETSSPNSINADFQAVDPVWRSAATQLLGTFSELDVTSKYKFPESAELVASTIETEEIRQSYLEAVHQTKQRLNELTKLKGDLLLDLKALNFRLVSDAGRIRSRLITLCREFGGCDGVRGFNERYLTGIALELRVLPLKFLAGSLNKVVEFNAKIKSGFDGRIDVARQVLVFLFLLLLPLLAHRFLSWVSRWLNRLRERILSKSILDYRKRTQFALWIRRVNPFVPSVGMIGSIHLARGMIETTDLLELSHLLFYVEIYFVYRATRILLTLLLELVLSSESLDLAEEVSSKSEVSARRLSRFFFGQYVVLHIIEDTVRRAFVYGIASELLFVLAVVVVIYEFQSWKSELLDAFRVRFPRAWKRIKPILEKRFSALALPLLFVLVTGNELFRLLSHQLVKFDFFKRILSEVFKKKLEQESDSLDQPKEPDSSYLSFFDYYLPAEKDFYIDREPLMAKEILSTVNKWLADDTREDLVVLVGSRGIGKTTSAMKVIESADTENKVFRGVEPRISKREDFFRWLSDLVGSKIDSLESFVKFESKLEEKIVFVVDDIHNLFIGKIGGFESYRLFMEVVSAKTTKIFWCLTVNSHAWAYLKGVFGEEHFYGRVFPMRMWIDAEIQSLILARHNLTGCARSFDRSLSAYGTGNVLGEQVETQFFRLLWGQSRGNPRSALMYWISAISQTGKNKIHVGVPKFINSSVVGTMSNEALMILAAIARHDSLSEEEVFEATGIDKLIVRKCLKESMDKFLVWSDKKGRVRISSRAQSAIDYYLVGKKFLYE